MRVDFPVGEISSAPSEGFMPFLELSLKLAKENSYGHGLDWIVLKKFSECAGFLKEEEIFAGIKGIKELLQPMNYDLELQISILSMLMRPLIISSLMQKEQLDSPRERYIKVLYQLFGKEELFNRSLIGACLLSVPFKEELRFAHEHKLTISLLKTIHEILCYWSEMEGNSYPSSNIEILARIIARADELCLLDVTLREDLGAWLAITLLNQAPSEGFFRWLLLAKFSTHDALSLLLVASDALILSKKITVFKDILHEMSRECPVFLFFHIDPLYEKILKLEEEEQKKVIIDLLDELCFILCKISQLNIETEISYDGEENQLVKLTALLECEIKWVQLYRKMEEDSPSAIVFFKSYIFRRTLCVIFHEEHGKNLKVRNLLSCLIDNIKGELNIPLSMSESHTLFKALIHCKSFMDVQDEMLMRFLSNKFDVTHHLRAIMREYFLKKTFEEIKADDFLMNVKKFRSLDDSMRIDQQIAEDLLIVFATSNWAPKALDLIQIHRGDQKWNVKPELEKLLANHFEEIQKISLEQGLNILKVFLSAYEFTDELIVHFLASLCKRQKLPFVKIPLLGRFIQFSTSLKGNNKIFYLSQLYDLIFQGKIIDDLNFKELYQETINPDNFVFDEEKLNHFFYDLKRFLERIGRQPNPHLSQVAYDLLVFIGNGLGLIHKQMSIWQRNKLKTYNKIKAKVPKDVLNYDVSHLGWTSFKRTLLRSMRVCYKEACRVPESKALAITFLQGLIRKLDLHKKYICYPIFSEQEDSFCVIEQSKEILKWD